MIRSRVLSFMLMFAVLAAFTGACAAGDTDAPAAVDSAVTEASAAEGALAQPAVPVQPDADAAIPTSSSEAVVEEAVPAEDDPGSAPPDAAVPEPVDSDSDAEAPAPAAEIDTASADADLEPAEATLDSASAEVEAPPVPEDGGPAAASVDPASVPVEGDPLQPGAPDEAVSFALPPGYEVGNPATHPLAIERLRGLSYPGSDLVVVQELPAGSNYSRSVATYQSDGLTIRGLLTIPNGERPPTGWPVVIFNHGYIPPAQYRTTERYVAYQDAFARAGYITYKSDYRGHGSSEGESGSSRGTPDYTVDVMNALASVERHPDSDPERIGMWGHSMGGLVTLKSMVISDRIKAGVIWAGVVASYPDLYNRLGRSDQPSSGSQDRSGRRGWRTELVELFGPPEENAAGWDAVSPNAHLAAISGPLQLHHGTADSSVPVIYSTRLQEQMEAAGRPSETFVYEGDDHNLAGNLSTALARSVEFFDRHVKGGG